MNVRCPNDITQPARPGESYVLARWQEPSGTIGGVQADIVYRSHSPNLPIQVGADPVTVSYKLSDGNGVMVDCEFTIDTMGK